MAFDFGSLFAAVGRALPGYVEGHRAAVKDNWNDLNQYNQVQAGQFDNAWTEATWEDRLANVDMQRRNNALGLLRNTMVAGLDIAAYPGMYTQRDAMSANMPWVMDNYWRLFDTAMRRGAQNGMMPQMPNFSSPSGLR